MANTTENPTTGQGGGPGTEGQPSAPAKTNANAVLWWVLGFLITLAFIWIIVRVISGAWHIGGK